MNDFWTAIALWLAPRKMFTAESSVLFYVLTFMAFLCLVVGKEMGLRILSNSFLKRYILPDGISNFFFFSGFHTWYHSITVKWHFCLQYHHHPLPSKSELWLGFELQSHTWDIDTFKKHFQNVVLFKKKILKIPVFIPKIKNEPRYEVQIVMWSFFFFPIL